MMHEQWHQGLLPAPSYNTANEMLRK